MNKREQLGEPAFGEKLAPILKDIETAIWEHNANFEGERPLYPDEAMRSAACIFIDVLIDRMFAKQEKDGKPLKAREQEVTSVGRMLYETIKTCTGLDLHELQRRLIEEKRANPGAKGKNE